MTSENFLKLQQSQRQWILYRDMEFKLIESNWTRNNFGSSYRLSQFSYKSSVIKNRVIQLYYYANNY
ncbi:lysozyme inhibitor LprI family protein [Vibrio vulnificus]